MKKPNNKNCKVPVEFNRLLTISLFFIKKFHVFPLSYPSSFAVQYHRDFTSSTPALSMNSKYQPCWGTIGPTNRNNAADTSKKIVRLPSYRYHYTSHSLPAPKMALCIALGKRTRLQKDEVEPRDVRLTISRINIHIKLPSRSSKQREQRVHKGCRRINRNLVCLGA